MAAQSEAFSLALREARSLHMQGCFAEAAKRYDALLRLAPGHMELLHLSGIAALQSGDVARGVDLIERALAQKPDHAEARSNLGNGYRALQRPQEAIAAYDAALALRPNLVEALTNRGEVLLELGRASEGLTDFDAALAIRPQHTPAMLGRAGALLALHRPEEALGEVERVLALRPGWGPALVLRGRGHMLTRAWPKALAALDAAVDANPASHHAHLLRAMTLVELGRNPEALAVLDAVIADVAAAPAALLCRANLALSQGRLRAATQDFETLLNAEVEVDYARGHWLHTRMRLCDWAGIERAWAELEARVRAGHNVCHPLALLAIRDDPALQQRCAELFAPRLVARPFASTRSADKIRLAYVSSDFCDHPVAHLITGLIEAHNRDRFEVMALSLGRRRDQWTRRIASATEFIDVSDMSDSAVLSLARGAGLDLAVDLNGYTENARPQIFAARLAPVQMSYLGYLGSMGGDFIDYLVADSVIAPPELRGFYSEKIAYLPTYQWRGDRALAPGAPARRSDHGLPEDSFVYCSFNNNYKITPALFAAWMQILRDTPNSVLWLYAANSEARDNLIGEAKRHNIDAARLVFARKAALLEHLARQSLADLMLDTFPYTGGATGGNSLRAGLPVLTLQGRSFAARMGASLLSYAGLNELIAHGIEDYVRRAVDLAKAPTSLLALRAKLASAETIPAERFVLGLEDLYQRAVGRHRAGLAPAHLEPELGA